MKWNANDKKSETINFFMFLPYTVQIDSLVTVCIFSVNQYRSDYRKNAMHFEIVQKFITLSLSNSFCLLFKILFFLKQILSARW